MLRRTCTLLAFFTVSSLSTSFGDPNSQFSSMSGSSGKSLSLSVQTNSHSENGQYFQQIWVKGSGIDEKYDFSSSSPLSLSINNLGDSLVIADPTRSDCLMYTDQAGTLVIMQNGVCTKKLYKTVDGVTTSTSQIMSDSECMAIRQKATEKLEKNRVYWEKWSKDFNKNMQNSFPPGFPFNNQQGGPIGGAAAFSGNMFPFPMNGWADFGGNMANAFIPRGFPFTRR